jgi:2-polyprenyl-3-methyl-5-hydroxy-6-metoxy-1,4-benzoquinol methylase
MDKNRARQLQELGMLWRGFQASRVILTANNYNLFEYLKTPKTSGAIAQSAGIDLRAAEILLDALTALGLFKKKGKTYRNTSLSKTFLIKDSSWYQGDMLRHTDSLWKSWSNLDEVVKTGLPNRRVSSDNEAFIRGMHNNSLFRAEDVINRIDLRGVKKTLDLGGGPGTYSREIARRGIAVTLFDLPETVAVARRISAETKGSSLDYISGNYLSDDIGHGYDLVFISHIFHSLSPEESVMLLNKASKALNPKGRVVVQEFYLKENRAYPVSGALFAINMLVNTTSGRSYPVQEIRKWFAQTGYKNIKANIQNETVLVSGKKA